ncbi:MAG: HNH endonuclease [Micrococcales bacterium]|nr:HNH endonuclease [Micrococcales bacterium]
MATTRSEADRQVADRQVTTGWEGEMPDLLAQVPIGDIVAFAALLTDVSLPDARLKDLVARARGWDQLLAMAQAAQARVIGEFVGRRGVGRVEAADSLQCALGCSRYGAEQLVVRAEGLGTYPALDHAMAHGEVDARRADTIIDALPVAGDPHRWDGVVDAVLPEAWLWPVREVRKQTERLVMAAEPAQAAARCEQERAERCVRLEPSGYGMAWLSAYLPAPEAITAFTVIDALAGSHRHEGDTRNVGERRADAFSEIFTTIADTGVTPRSTALPRRQHRRWNVQVTVAAGTLLGLDELPAELGGYGPIPADMARRLAQDGTWRRLLTDPISGGLMDRGDHSYRPGADLTDTVIARDVTCTFPYCGQPAWRCELDHIVPFDPSRPADEQTTAANLHAACKHHHEQKTSGGWSVRRDPITGATEWINPFGIAFTRLATPLVLTTAALAHLPADSPGRRRGEGGGSGGGRGGGGRGGGGRGGGNDPDDEFGDEFGDENPDSGALAGEVVAGKVVTDGALADGAIAREVVAGEVVAGKVVTGEIVTGEIVTGEGSAGENRGAQARGSNGYPDEPPF